MDHKNESIDIRIEDDSKKKISKQNVKAEGKEQISRATAEHQELVDEIRVLELMQERSKIGLNELDIMKEYVDSLKPCSESVKPTTLPDRLMEIEQEMRKLQDKTRELCALVKKKKLKKMEELMMRHLDFDSKGDSVHDGLEKSSDNIQKRDSFS